MRSPIGLPLQGFQMKGRSIVSSCSNANRTDVLDLICYDIKSLRVLYELCMEDDGAP